MRVFSRSARSCISSPSTRTVPLVGGKMPSSMRMVVVLPAPFGPRKPTISPGATSRLTPSTAVRVA